MGWLNAVPKPDERRKAAQPQFQRPELSRLARMNRDKVPVLMPPNPAPELVKRLIEIGLTEAAGVGAGPLTWGTIEAWQRSTSVPLQPWEARLYKHLSTEYLAEYRKAESENCPPPWKAEVTERERELELKQLEAALG